MRGRGNPTLAIVFSTDMSINGKHIPSRDQVMDNIRFINNSIDGDLRMEHAKAVLFDGNRFASGQSLLFGNSRELRLRGNTIGQVTLSDLSQIQFMDDATRQSTEIK